MSGRSRVAGWLGAACLTLAFGLVPIAGPAQEAPRPVPVAPLPELQLSQTGVPAEASGKDGVVARDEALANGRRAAWNRMLEQAGVRGAPSLSDTQLDALVQSIVIEQERPSPTRYSGRITVNFSARAVRGVLGNRAATAPGGTEAGAAAPVAPSAPTVWAEAMVSYTSLQEWLEVQRRLRASPAIASVELRGVAVDAARLRLGLRRLASEAMPALAGLGATLVPAASPEQAEYWQLTLAGGE